MTRYQPTTTGLALDLELLARILTAAHHRLDLRDWHNERPTPAPTGRGTIPS